MSIRELTSARGSSGYIPTLDGWRAVAIGLVLFAHAGLSGPLARLADLQRIGPAGVDLFFAISGLLICSRLLDEERSTGGISLRSFYVRRSFRILPAAYVYLLVVGVVGALHGIPMDWPAWGSAWVFLRNYFICLVRDTPAGRFTGHFWSLAIEEHFYLLLPFVLVTFPRQRKAVLLGLTVAAFVWFGVYVCITPPDERSIFWKLRTDLRIGSLLFPAMLALLLAEPVWRERFARWLKPNRLLALLVVALVGYLVRRYYFLDAPVLQVDAPQGMYTSAPRGGTANLFRDVFEPMCFPLVILATMLHPGTWLGRLLEWRPLRVLGRASYSVYLWQQMFWVAPYRGWPIAAVQSPAVAALIVAALAAASYLLLEKPLIRVGHRFARPVTPGHRDLEVVAGAVSVVSG